MKDKASGGEDNLALHASVRDRRANAVASVMNSSGRVTIPIRLLEALQSRS